MIVKRIADELIPVYETSIGERVVDARELHDFLEVGRDFTTWIKDRIEKYGFVDGEDFSPVLVKTNEGGRPRTEYTLKIDMAKELCMVENNSKGSEARKYFIDIERSFKSDRIDISKLDPQMQMFHHMFQSVAKTQLELAETQRQLEGVQTTVAAIQDTFMQQDEDWRKMVNGLMKGASFRSGGNYRELRNKSYEMLEERGRCDLNTRLRNLRTRLEDNGATKTRIEQTTKMDVIENDPRLKEIYTTIVKELSIGTLKIVGG